MHDSIIWVRKDDKFFWENDAIPSFNSMTMRYAGFLFSIQCLRNAKFLPISFVETA